MAALYFSVVLLALAALSSAFPALPVKTKRSSLAEDSGLSKDLAPEDGPLEDVSRVLERYARQIASSPKGSTSWTSLHRNVLRGALQVTKQLLSYEGWTPNHLELLKGERETLSELVAVEGEGLEEDGGPAEDKEGPPNNEGVASNGLPPQDPAPSDKPQETR